MLHDGHFILLKKSTENNSLNRDKYFFCESHTI
jgi:hypothetical protein